MENRGITLGLILLLNAPSAMADDGLTTGFSGALLRIAVAYLAIIFISHLAVTCLSKCGCCRSIHELNCEKD